MGLIGRLEFKLRKVISKLADGVIRLIYQLQILRELCGLFLRELCVTFDKN